MASKLLFYFRSKKGKGGLVGASLLKSEGLLPSWFISLSANHARYV